MSHVRWHVPGWSAAIPKHVQLLDFPGVDGPLERYLNAVRYGDDFVGRLVRAYASRGLADRTLFVILGDHGEGFGEHGRPQQAAP